jgi:signal transduction histidine kinase
VCTAPDERIAALCPGAHVCAIHTHAGEQLSTVSRYLRAGLENGQRAISVTGDPSRSDVCSQLGADGVDVAAAQQSGRLQLLTPEEIGLKGRPFAPKDLIECLRDIERQATAAGCTGLRVASEMTWATAGVSGGAISNYETALHRFFAGSRSQGLCHYHRGHFESSMLVGVLRMHPMAVIGQQVCPNPYFEPPHLGDGAVNAAEARLELMIEQILQLREHELRLQDAVAARDEFLSVAAHELRTPLHALTLAVRSLPTDGISQSGADRIVRQVQRLNRLIDAAFDVARLRERQSSLSPELCDLRTIAEQVVARFDLEAAHSESPVCADVPSILGVWDRHSLDQILSNLLSNALKYGAGQPIDVVARRMNMHVVLQVRDRGIGVPREHRHRIFERFERAASPRTHTGFGLGLWVVRETASALGGDVKLVDVEGPGAAFEVTLPLGITEQACY